jgi:hypothetical protein
MKEYGIGLIIIGVLASGFSYIMDVTVDGSGYSSVVNLQKLQTQMMVFESGLALLVAGAILVALS